MNISHKTIKLLFMKSGGLCAFPKCETPLIYPESNKAIIGEICHIISPRQDGPRYDKDFPEDMLNEEDNLILLCSNHHTLIDKDFSRYTPEVLKEIKKTHESNIRRRISIGEPWDADIADLYYINIPRIASLSAINGIQFDNSLIDIKYLNLLGLELNKIVLKVIDLIRVIKPKALSIDKIYSLDPGLTGLTISFSDNFRTKNMQYPQEFENTGFVFKGKLFEDPLIYKKYNNFKLVLTLNPRWVTYSTAYGEFLSGWARVSGICIVKKVDIDKKLVIASPLILGIPRSPFECLLSDGPV